MLMTNAALELLIDDFIANDYGDLQRSQTWTGNSTTPPPDARTYIAVDELLRSFGKKMLASSPLETPAAVPDVCPACGSDIRTYRGRDWCTNAWHVATPAPADTGAPCQSGPCSAMAPAGKKFCESCSTGDTPQPQAAEPDILECLKSACKGYPYAKIAWPHYLLHDAMAEIIKLRAALGKTPDTLPLLQKIVNLFDGDFEDPGLEIYGLIGGTEMCRGGQMLNDLLAEARLLLAPRLATPDAREEKEK